MRSVHSELYREYNRRHQVIIDDFFRKSTALEYRFVDPVLESSCTGVYTVVLRAVSPRSFLTAASLERSLFK
ncbi:TPA: hypothetical protein ACPSKE_000875 [Legionella feeleii]